jgi:hypothetical protein
LANIQSGSLVGQRHVMVIKKAFALFTLSISITYSLQASVWDAQRDWSTEDEERYSAWVQSDAVHVDLFQSKSSPYSGVKVDCADTAYAFRAVFAYENGLPFKIKNPSYRRGGKAPRYLTQELTAWDKLPTERERVVAFINHLGVNLGTETLSLNDSYPVALEAIAPADFFMFKLVRDNPIRHTYVLKGITEVGNFDVIYSTQALKKDNKPLALKKDYELKHAPTLNHWGFKRFILPEFYDERPLEEAADFSREQYDLAKTLGERKFFKEVKKRLASSMEDPAAMVSRKLKALCEQVQERISAVQAGVDYASKIKNRCMNYQEFDAYSTPNRDGEIRSSVGDLRELWAENQAAVSGPEERAVLEFLFENGEASEHCQVTLSSGKKLNFKQALEAIEQKKASFHPNDTLDKRWGQGNQRGTACEVFYE